VTRSLLLLCLITALLGCGSSPPAEPAANGPACIASFTQAWNSNLDGFDQELTIWVANSQKTALRVKYPKENMPSDYGVLFVTGIDGGYIQPADRIYSRIAQKMAEKGGTSAFVRYRNPGELGPSLEDARAAVIYLKNRGVKKIAALGMSFGGAIVIHTALNTPEVSLVIGFSPQGADTEPVERLKNQGLLVVHSEDDENVPYNSSVDLLMRAPKDLKKELFSLKGANHFLDGFSREIDPVVNAWIESYFPSNPEQPEAAHCP